MRIVRKAQKFLRKMKLVKSYDKRLIDELKKEHNVLISLYSQIESNLQEKNYSKVLKLLKDFHKEFKEHIEFEDEYFYSYVKLKYRFVLKELQLIEQKQQEMQKISTILNKFMEDYNSVEAIKQERFKEDLNMIANALTNRIEFEETKLYSYY